MAVEKAERKVIITELHFKAAATKVYSLLDGLPDDLRYHCRDHTEQQVVPSSLRIAMLENLTPEARWLVGVAALFHDTGFVEQYNGNEAIGARVAEEHMRAGELPYTEAQIQAVIEAILNTNMKASSPSQLAKVLGDADLSVIGHPDFLDWHNRLREEVLLHPESPMFESAGEDRTWGRTQLNFLVSHSWLTAAASSLFDEQKRKNIEAFRKKYQL